MPNHYLGITAECLFNGHFGASISVLYRRGALYREVSLHTVVCSWDSCSVCYREVPCYRECPLMDTTWHLFSKVNGSLNQLVESIMDMANYMKNVSSVYIT